jgi:hypothetical protein
LPADLSLLECHLAEAVEVYGREYLRGNREIVAAQDD